MPAAFLSCFWSFSRNIVSSLLELSTQNKRAPRTAASALVSLGGISPSSEVARYGVTEAIPENAAEDYRGCEGKRQRDSHTSFSFTFGD